MGARNPYHDLPPEAFWRSGVAEVGLFGYTKLWASRWQLPEDARFSTYGSCFAQHISRALMARDMNWVDAEPAPGRTPRDLAAKYNYGVFSSRTGNIYTAAQLRCWAGLAEDPDRVATIELWPGNAGRVTDSLRPVVEPGGFASEHEARMSLRSNALAFRRSITETDVFVFTLGLTEGWEHIETGQPYPMCPGTVAGSFDPGRHVFRNYSYPETADGLEEAFAKMWALNPGLKILLTVSPVPLTATAEDQHVLVSTTYSKSTLRAVAGDLARAYEAIDYFPSYEIIAAPSSRGTFFEPNMRSVAQEGVNLVMGHFFAGLNLSGEATGSAGQALEERKAAVKRAMAEDELVCEEMSLEVYNET